MKLYIQKTINDCGLACIAMIASYTGINKYKIQKATQSYNLNLKKEGLSIMQMEKAFEDLGIKVRSFFIKNIKILKFYTPLIINIKKDNSYHYVVIKKIVKNNYYIWDPEINTNKYWLNTNELKSIFTGYTIVLSSKI